MPNQIEPVFLQFRHSATRNFLINIGRKPNSKSLANPLVLRIPKVKDVSAYFHPSRVIDILYEKSSSYS
jgi:hypothetical protein